jgi:hypothetical protein
LVVLVATGAGLRPSELERGSHMHEVVG